MHFSLSEYFLWLFGSLLYGALAWLLTRKRAYRQRPGFTAWIYFTFAEALPLFLVSQLGSSKLYTAVYWLCAFTEVALQVGVALEFAARAFSEANSQESSQKLPLLLGTSFLALLSLVLAIQATPAVTSVLDAFYTRVDLFAAVFMCLLTACTLGVAYVRGTMWQLQELYRFWGFLIWSTTMALVDTMHVYWRTQAHFALLEVVRMTVNYLVVGFWIILIVYPRKPRPNGELRGLETLTRLYRLQ